MARIQRDTAPEFALVVWPDDADQELPSCILLCGLDEALAYGAVLIAREDDALCYPRDREPRITFLSNPVRRDYPDDNGAEDIDEE